MKRSILAFSLAIAAGPLALLACGEEAPAPKNPTTVTVTPPASSSVAVTPSAAPSPSVTTPPPPPPPPAPVVNDVPNSEDPKVAPIVKITAPAMNASIDPKKAADFVVKLDVKNWDLKEGKHVHLILDNGAYFRVNAEELKAGIKLSALPGGADLKEGQHFLAAFPGRHHHESVKTKGAITVSTFWIGKAAKVATIDLKKPFVIYSRPKGSNNGDMGKAVFVDFALWGTALDKGEKVTYTITGATLTAPVSGEFVKWAPKSVLNLQKGDYELKLQLVDKDGKAVEQPFPAAGKFSVDASAPNDAPMAMPAAAASSAAPAASTSAKPAPVASASAKKG
jgi:hypothetical protein